MNRPLADRLREKAHDPLAWTEVVQLVKTVVAAVVAWILAAEVLDLPQPFLAPWAALLVVHATVYSTFSRGAQQVGATVVGVILSWMVGSILGLDPVAIGVLLLAGMVLGQLAWVREEGTTVAATALIVLTTGYSDDGNFLLLRLADTAIGIGVGGVVNLLVWPPFRDRAAARAIDAVDDRVGGLLQEMAESLRQSSADEHQVRAWVDRTTEIDDEVDQAWALVRRSRESGWFNPRRSAREVRNPTEFGEILHRIEQSVAETRSMARSIDHSVVNVTEWDPVFKDRWVGLLDDTGAAILEPDSARQGQIRERLGELVGELSTGDLPTQHWPEYGGLILNLRNIVGSMDVVAKANPVRVRRGRPLLRE